MLQVNVKTEDLLRAVNLTVSVSEKKSTLPILSHFLIEAKDDSLIVTASDLETTIQETCPATVYSPGRLTVSAKAFHSMVRSINTESINLTEGDRLTLELLAGQFKTVFFGLAAESFPKLLDESDFVCRTLNSKDLINAIDKVIYSVSARDERYNLSGVYMTLEENEDKKSLRLVSSDSKRLNISTIVESVVDFELERGVIISKKGIQELRRLAETVDSIEVGVSFTCVMAKTPTSLLELHLLEGGFPDYRMVVPLNHDKNANINRLAFLECLKRVSLISDEASRVGKFEFTKDNLHITLANSNVGQAEESLAIEYDGEPLTTGFNLSFYIETLSNLVSDIISITFQDPKQSFLVTGRDDPGYFGIVMTSTY
ncbi:MAG: DNA polymerase III subunit beta [Deltaproteobacteria bacterium]|jgi:DNA polymerase-3 subunit beta|nr:DNA polymerase III subunit beta [Deltaproteobacteria bacterium]